MFDLSRKQVTAAVFAFFIVLVSFGLYISYYWDFTPLSDHNEVAEVSCGVLDGEDLYGLYADWVGFNGTCIEKVEVNFADRLQDMWNKKKGNPVAEKTGKKLVREYRQQWFVQTTSIGGYIELVDDVVDETAVNWEKLASEYSLNPSEKRLVMKIGENVHGVDMVAYSMTELLPEAPESGKDWKFNMHVFDWILKNGGLEYLRRMPAIYDSKTSFGPYQFTEYALHDAQGIVRGASRANHAVRPKIPGSVSELRGNDHARAAYLFVLHNVAKLVQGLSEKEEKILSENLDENWASFTGYFAAAHFLPAGARPTMEAWIEHGMSGNYLDYVKYRYSEGQGIPLTYVKKHKHNREVLIEAGYGPPWWTFLLFLFFALFIFPSPTSDKI
ncbi:MAG: hypothetical protein ABEJ24_04115 [Candidatus Magasanikbacteria bacterium]